MEARTRETEGEREKREGGGGGEREREGEDAIKQGEREGDRACKKQAERVSFINLEYWEKSTATQEGY